MNFLKREYVFSFITCLLIILSLINPKNIANYPEYVDWRTIWALIGLLILTTGLMESGYFQLLSYKILDKIQNVRKLAITMILLAAFLSTFLTNDITLFVVVPITIGMQRYLTNVTKLIIFEAIAVNAGSSLTPIGNPQNLYLWHQWGVSFLDFVVKMSPLALISVIVLVLFGLICFEGKLEYSRGAQDLKIDRELFTLSFFLLFIYIVSLELHWEIPVLFIIIILYSTRYKNVLKQVDWILILLFIFVFIDFHIISTISFITRNAQRFPLTTKGEIFLFSAFVSQIISNVPASVFVSKFTNNWSAIAYGVNVGGNGVIIGSLANLIALRMTPNRKAFWIFHRYSLPYFILTTLIIYVFLM